MAKKKNNGDKFDAKHKRNVKMYELQIDKIYKEAIREAVALSESLGDVDTDKPFTFDDYPVTRKRIDKLMSGLKSNVEVVVLNGIKSEWTLANNKNNVLCDFVFGKNKGKLTQEQYRRYYSNNDEARQAFEQRRTNGLNLSDRVWNYTKQFKEEIEMGLDLGIRAGRSAEDMSRDIRQYLRKPNELFRRVRDEHGQLHLSKRAAAYHPGQGVYRSSYKNARRLTATETNMAYNTSDHLRWQQLDFVVGIEVRLSGNHTCLGGDGKPHEFTDICDELAGKYPKTFKFTGWHPQCRCIAISILKTQEEIDADTQKILNGEPIDGGSVNTVKDVPQAFKDWIGENTSRIARTKHIPNFITDNMDLVVGISSDKYPNTKVAEIMMKYDFDRYKQFAGRSAKIDNYLSQIESANTDIGKALIINQLKRECANLTYQDLQEWGVIDDTFTWAKTEFGAITHKPLGYIDEKGKIQIIPEKRSDLMVFKDKNGLEIAYPIGIKKEKAFSAVDASEAIDEFPPYLRKGIKRVTFLDYPNPADPYWRVKYKDPNHVSMATDGGSTQFYLKPKDKDDFKGVMAHEAGHIIDGEKERFSSSQDWKDAISADLAKYAKLPRMGYVSAYAMKHNREDFAESIRKYTTDHEYMKSWLPNRAALIRKIAQRLSNN